MKALSVAVAFLAAAITLLAIALLTTPSANAAPAAQPKMVQVCTTYPCKNAQELTVADHNGAPIFSVPEYGPVSTWGAGFQVSTKVFAKPSVSLNLNGTITLKGVTLTPRMVRFLKSLMKGK